MTTSPPTSTSPTSHPDTPHPAASGAAASGAASGGPVALAGADAPVAHAGANAPVAPDNMTRAAIIAELRALRATTKLNIARDQLELALTRARRGEGLKPTAAAPTVAPQWTQIHMVSLIEVVVMMANVVAAIVGGYNREQLDNNAPGPWTRVAEVFNHDDVEVWEDAPDDTDSLAIGAAVTPPASHHRTWSYLKDKWGQLKSAYTIPLARFTASGQGDPDAAFSNFLHPGDNHPRVLTYLHYRLQSIDTSSMDGMGSRLIRQDAVHDNDVSYRGNPRRTRRRTSEDGGFLTNATEQDIGRLFAMARPDNSAARLDVLMTHYAHLPDDVQRSVDQLIRREVDALTTTLSATLSPPAPNPGEGRRRVARRRAHERRRSDSSPEPESIEEQEFLVDSDDEPAPARPVIPRRAPADDSSDSTDDDSDDLLGGGGDGV